MARYDGDLSGNSSTAATGELCCCDMQGNPAASSWVALLHISAWCFSCSSFTTVSCTDIAANVVAIILGCMASDSHRQLKMATRCRSDGGQIVRSAPAQPASTCCMVNSFAIDVLLLPSYGRCWTLKQQSAWRPRPLWKRLRLHSRWHEQKPPNSWQNCSGSWTTGMKLLGSWSSS